MGYAGVHGGFGYGIRNTDGSRIPEFADSLGLVICNMCFMKQNSKLVSYESGPSKSTVDYLLVRNRDKMMVRNAMVFQTRYAFQITNY